MYRSPLRFLRSTAAAVLLAGSLFVFGPAGGALAANSWSGSSASYPWDCLPRSDNPHLSTTPGFQGFADAKGWVICRTQRPTEHVDSTLYRQDCWWVFCWNTAVGFGAQDGPPFYVYGTVRAIPSYYCNGSASHNYVINSNHRITDFDGTTWYAFTSSSAVLSCG
jgi:hypothetical protein